MTKFTSPFTGKELEWIDPRTDPERIDEAYLITVWNEALDAVRQRWLSLNILLGKIDEGEMLEQILTELKK